MRNFIFFLRFCGSSHLTTRPKKKTFLKCPSQGRRKSTRKISWIERSNDIEYPLEIGNNATYHTQLTFFQNF